MVRRLIGALVIAAGLAACGSSATTTAQRSGAGSPLQRSVTIRQSRQAHRAAVKDARSQVISATMTIAAGPHLLPPVIALPGRVHLKLTVRDGDGHAHTVVLGPARVHVPAGGRASLDVRHLAVGPHAVTLDGHPGAKLTVGSEGGP